VFEALVSGLTQTGRKFATVPIKMEAQPHQISPSPDHAIVWQGESLYLLDQRYLPAETTYLRLDTPKQAADAIRQMVVRGAPAIGITAAYAVVLAAAEACRPGLAGWKARMSDSMALLRQSRPTAVNLFWALQRMTALISHLPEGESPLAALLEEARRIHREDIEANQTMGALGADLIGTPTQVITHCNAGALATGGFGTALGVIRAAHARGLIEQVYADETRPWMQGARLTAWELLQDRIPVTLLAEGAAASLLRRGDIGWVIVGSDRIAANGDVANKIGTYGLAVAARHHGVKFMVAAPTSTIDMSMAHGGEIPIEVREGDELLSCGGRRIAAEGAKAWNPVFDVTPAELVDAIVTEKGVVLSPDEKKMRNLMGS
jgi:methylthioribose-1-phosphate isomerase